MDKKSMDEQVNKELEELCPRGTRGGQENQVRAAYSAQRKHDLSNDPHFPKEESYKKAVNAIQK